MGQRSQIYINYQKDNKNYLIARYYQWNYGERMISRCRYTLEWIKESLGYSWLFTSETESLKRILDVNFDMKDVVIGCDIINEYAEQFSDEDFNDYVFKMQDNNDGKLFININDDEIKYAFLDCQGDTNKIMSATQYMSWDMGKDWRQDKYIGEEQKRLCEENLSRIRDFAKLMTKEEVDKFIGNIYENNPIKPF